MRKQKMILLLICLAVFFLRVETEANCLIELKSGRTFVSSHCWEENGQIMFYQLGGVVGFPSDQVAGITDTDRPEPREIPGVEPEMDRALPQVPGAPDDVHTEEKPSWLDMDSKEFQEKVGKYQEELKRILAGRSKYLFAFEQAEIKNDTDKMEIISYKLRDLQYLRVILRSKVLEMYGNILPDWWDELLETR